MTTAQRIKEVEEEMGRTQKNKVRSLLLFFFQGTLLTLLSAYKLLGHVVRLSVRGLSSRGSLTSSFSTQVPLGTAQGQAGQAEARADRPACRIAGWWRRSRFRRSENRYRLGRIHRSESLVPRFALSVSGPKGRLPLTRPEL